MRILYGVVGEGMGHATRSKVIIEHLVKEARHEVEIVVSGRAHGFLTRAFPSLKVHEIAGLSMIYANNKVSKFRTALQFIKSIPAFTENMDLMDRMREGFRPELCIADFESFAYQYARQHRLPVLSIDNMQIINRCKHRGQVELPESVRTSYRLAKEIVRAKLPRCDHYLITTFFFPPIRKKRTSLYPPILRDGILDAKATATVGDHVLVYQTSDSFHDLVPTLQKLPTRFIVYGLKKNAELGNVTLKEFSETGFVDDLKTARAVLAGGGFSLMGEAVYLGKPLLSVPLEGQFEQTLNALYLEKLGYGEYHHQLSGEGIAKFLDNVDRYAEKLTHYRQDRNHLILASLDELIEEIGLKGRLVDVEKEEESDDEIF